MRRSYMAGNGSSSYEVHDPARMLEDENQRMEEELKRKTRALKTLSIDIGTEVREQNKYLSQMDDDFDSSTGLLSKTMGRLQQITRAGHWKMWLYMALFALFVFFLCWVIIKFR